LSGYFITKLAHELQVLTGYADCRNFLNAVDKAKESCKSTGEAVSDHFVDIIKKVGLSKGQKLEVESLHYSELSA